MTLNLLVIYINIGKRAVPVKEPTAFYYSSLWHKKCHGRGLTLIDNHTDVICITINDCQDEIDLNISDCLDGNRGIRTGHFSYRKG